MGGLVVHAPVLRLARSLAPTGAGRMRSSMRVGPSVTTAFRARGVVRQSSLKLSSRFLQFFSGGIQQSLLLYSAFSFIILTAVKLVPMKVGMAICRIKKLRIVFYIPLQSTRANAGNLHIRFPVKWTEDDIHAPVLRMARSRTPTGTRRMRSSMRIGTTVTTAIRTREVVRKFLHSKEPLGSFMVWAMNQSIRLSSLIFLGDILERKDKMSRK